MQEIIVVGNLWADNGYNSASGRVYSGGGISPCIGASHFEQVKYILEHKCENNRNESEEKL